MTQVSKESAGVVVEHLRAWNAKAVSQVIEYRGQTTIVVPKELLRATAQDKLGDLVFVELPSVGTKFTKGAAAATVESVKAASDVYAPVSGEVTEINAKVGAEPALVNSAPTGDGWLFKLKIADVKELDGLLDEQAYNATIAQAG